jgi:hypothetical protein
MGDGVMAPRLCGVCGVQAAAMFRAPPAETAPDLDLRPGEPTRSTLVRWVVTCPNCHAAAPDLTALSPALRPVVQGDAYGRLEAEIPPYALAFVRWAKLCQAAAIPSAEAWLQAAWTADDAADTTHAVAWRRQAAAAWGQPADPSSALQLVDILRRAGDFPAAAAHATQLAAEPLDETSRGIVAFQRSRIEAGDSGRHLISSALRPPASRPHVSHKQGAHKPDRPGGFWSRLFGNRP